MLNKKTNMDKKILFIITSYKRVEMLKSLLIQLKGKGDIIVFDDNSDFSIEGNGIEFYKFKKNYGKKLAWLKFQKIFKKVKRLKKYDYYFMLPDDVKLCEDFVNKSIELWEGIEDSKKVSLSFSNPARCKAPQFTFIQPKIVGDVILTGWLDMMFLCTKELFNKIDITEIPLSRWEENELLGSGVGSQISNKLVDAGFTLYNTKDKLINHLGNNDSKMNPVERVSNPL